MTSYIMIAMLLLSASISDVTAYADMFSGFSDSIKYGYYSWTSVEDHKVQCPPNSVTCQHDKLGYSSLRRILIKLDDNGDKNGNIAFGEGVIDTSKDYIRDLNRYHTGYNNVLLNAELASITYAEVWEKWTRSSG